MTDESKQAERQRLLDTFAAAALTGISNDQRLAPDAPDWERARYAYDLAEAILTERERRLAAEEAAR